MNVRVDEMAKAEPNERQKRMLVEHELDPEHWLVLEEDKYQIVFVSKRKSRRRTIEKRSRRKYGERKNNRV